MVTKCIRTGHIVVVFGNGTVNMMAGKTEDSEIDNCVFFAHQEEPKPIGSSSPEFIGINSDTLPNGSVRLEFNNEPGFWNLFDFFVELASQNYQPTNGLQMVVRERFEQLKKHGYTVAHDVEKNGSKELIMAVEALLSYSGDGDFGKFPGSWEVPLCQKMFEKPLIQRLAIAGALIAAQIDVLLNENS
jgi:hypothetical protein